MLFTTSQVIFDRSLYADGIQINTQVILTPQILKIETGMAGTWPVMK